ncbi:hypothetical protein H4582DRAFT_1098220 [Lactarius indigo]|nr:hypothetical protein H4582DRAFT_1098220 [Lactarius indigo]
MPTLSTFDNSQSTLTFPRPFVHSPRVAYGLRKLDMGYNADIRLSSTVQDATKTSANCKIASWADTTLYSAAVDVIALAPADLDFLTGEHTRNLYNNPNDPASVRIDFERPFVTPPKVVVFFNNINLYKNYNWRLNTTATSVDVKGFTLNIETWSDTILYSARVGWIAYPEDREHIFSTSVNTMDVRPSNQPQPKQSNKVGFGAVEFFKAPSVFIAFNELDIDHKANFRVNSYVDNVTTTGLEWHIESWADTTLYSTGATIIAFN